MLTEQEAEKFADWIIAQEKKLMDIKFPKENVSDDVTNEELLEMLYA